MSSSGLASCLVSVVIPTFNCSHLLPGAIDSALAQTHAPLEVVVVDDGSTDDTARVARTYGDRIRYVHQQNQGTAAARNTGIAHSSGEYIALLDQDDRWLPQKLERQLPYFLPDPSVGLVHTGGRVIDSASGAVTSEYLPPAELDVHELMAWCRVGCATVVLRRAALEAVGGFDPKLPGADDWDLWIRVAARYRVLGCPEVLVEIHEHPGNQGKRVERMYTVASDVVRKHRNLHPGCAQCGEASRSAEVRLREDYYVKTCAASTAALRARRVGLAAQLRARALLRNPRAITRLPLRVLALLRPTV